MQPFITGMLLGVGLLNLYPLVGVIGASWLQRLYGITITPDQHDLLLLLRHRAVLFGILGAFIVFAAFQVALQRLAIIAGLLSMVTYVVLSVLERHGNDALRKVMLADVVASVVLLVTLLLITVK